MSVNEETIDARPAVKVSRRKAPLINRFVDFVSSVRFGVTLLCILVFLSMIGMLIIQQNVEGFDSYYASLTPAEKSVYGSLGLFDIYHSWYYNVLLLVLSLNIILASLDRFPSAWAYIVDPKRTATRPWLLNQDQNAVINVPSGSDAQSISDKVSRVLAGFGMKPSITESTTLSYGIDETGKRDFNTKIEETSKNVFGQTGKFNRIGAYIVHVSLLTLFLGHFVALQTGFDADVRMIPGDSTDKIQMIRFDLDKKEKFDVQLPFTMTCTDIQQRLIDPNGSIDVTNTLDWRTQLRVDDPEYGTTIADVSMNKPFNYRGFRFFQAQTIPIGNARNIVLDAVPIEGGTPVKLEIPRLGSAQMPDGTVVEYEEFLPDFTFNSDGRPDTRSGEYNNPAAVLGVTQPGSERVRVFAFEPGKADNLPVGAPKAGYKWSLVEYEKSPFAHVLSIKYDPYSGAFIAWYFGGIGLMFALSYVFFFSHRRVWARIEKKEDGSYDIVLAGDTNRNHAAFEEKFKKIEKQLTEAVDGSVVSASPKEDVD
jgi:cytochrome c biogenesis protein